jgi:UDP-3-O-[3-hydroxymyristoyl] glucosamine N-acyltransferase
VKFSDLIVSLGELVIRAGSQDCDLHGAAAITAATPSSISFVIGAKYRAALEQTSAAAVILPDRPELVEIARDRGLSWLTTTDPRLAFARTIEQFYVSFRPAPGIDHRTTIDPDTTLGQNVSIAAGVTIYHNVTLGDHVCLLPNVTIYPGVTIGAGTTIHAGVTLYQDTQIGDHCTIHAGAQIGADGFGFVQTPTGWEKMPQSGYVKLGDFVEVGANSAIDRPAVGVTSIGLGTKIDNLVQVGHGCTIGEHCLLCGQVGLAGGVTVGDFSVLAGQTGVVDGVTIAPGSIVAGRSVVRQDTKPGQWAGDPLLPLPQWLKLAAKLKRLARS